VVKSKGNRLDRQRRDEWKCGSAFGNEEPKSCQNNRSFPLGPGLQKCFASFSVPKSITEVEGWCGSLPARVRTEGLPTAT
jgi:hypothetical protein